MSNSKMPRSRRFDQIPGFSIDAVASAAGSDPEVLRLENLDTDLPPPAAAIEATRKAAGSDDANSYLPFTGSISLRNCLSEHLKRLSGHLYNPADIVITCGGTEAILDAILALTDPGDEVVLTDPTYAGMTNRVRLAGAIPRLVPFRVVDQRWRLDSDALRRSITPRTRVLFLMSPSMPSGGMLTRDDWNLVAELCNKNSLWLLYNSAMERILYDNIPHFHPVSLSGLEDRTVIIGSVSKEYRMIGWRVGWVAGPPEVMADVAKAHIYNVVTVTGIAQEAAKAAIIAPESDLQLCVNEWQRRRDMVLSQLQDYPAVIPDGGWSFLIDVSRMGLDAGKASRLLLERGKIAATPMTHWGEVNGDMFVRFVFSNETTERLSTVRDRVKKALG